MRAPFRVPGRARRRASAHTGGVRPAVPLALLVLGCSSGAERAEPVTATTPAVVRPAAEPAPRAAPEPAPPADAPTAAFIRRLATGAEPFASHVSPERGVVFVEYFSDASGQDPRADAQGVVKEARRLCGDELSGRLDRLREDLARRVETSAHDPLFTCSGRVCTFPAEMEYDLGGELRFAPGLVLESVVRTEGGPVTEEFVAEAERWAEDALRRLEGGRCR